MKSRKGQATRVSLLILHRFGHVALLVLFVVLVLFALFGFRLSEGPIALPRLASWFATQFTGEGVEVRIGKAELAWAGYHQGGEVPFVLKLADIQVRTDSGDKLADVPEAVLSLPVVDLFGGRKSITLDGRGATFPESDVPVSWYAKLWPGKGFTFSHSDVHVEIGAGIIGQGRNAIGVQHAKFVLSILHGGLVNVTKGQVQLAQKSGDAPILNFSFQGRYLDNWRGALHVELDKLPAQTLASVWPVNLLPNTRQWMTTHIISGRAQDADFVFELAANGDLSHLRIQDLQGQFHIDDVSLIWLQGAPPLVHMNGLFTMQTLDTGVLTADSGEIDLIKVKNGTLKITGLASPTQNGSLSMTLFGPVKNVLDVLAAPPLALLGHIPDAVKKATGTAQAHLTAHIPFQENLKENEIAIQVQAALTNLRVPNAFAGLGFTNGSMFLKSDGHRFSATAQAEFAGFPAYLSFEEDFSQPEDHGYFTMTGKAGPLLLQALGINTAYISMQGDIPFDVRVNETAHNQQQVNLALTLTPANLAIPLLGWTKPFGLPGYLNISFALKDQSLTSVQDIDAKAPGLLILGQNAGSLFTLQQAVIGRNQIQGTLTSPLSNGAPWVLQLSGSTLDLRLKALSQQNEFKSFKADFPWQMNLAFAQLYTAPPPAPALSNMRLVASGHGDQLIMARVSAQDVKMSFMPVSKGQQRLSLQGSDAGFLLDSLGVYSGIKGGALSLNALFGNGPLKGILQLQNIRLVHAPGFVKILQAATLYGLAEAASGPGLELAHTTIPFTLNQSILHLYGADSYSAALGFTASGTVNLATYTCDLETTIIPAYALNSFLGGLPLIGHLFTAEKGGGLLAMRAHVSGNLTNPNVEINPLSLFLPGFLRGIFGLGDPTPSPGK